jgi:hypothetical protein
MSPARTPRPAPPTTEQQAMAYRQLRRPGWPDTLEAALARPAYATAINGLARNLHRGGVRPAAPATPRAPAAAVPARRVLWTFDHKKAACNDRD